MKFKEISDAFEKYQTKTLKYKGTKNRCVIVQYHNEKLKDFPLYKTLSKPCWIGFGISTKRIYARFFKPDSFAEGRVNCDKKSESICDMAKEIYKYLEHHYYDATKKAEDHLISTILLNKLCELIPLGEKFEWHNSLGLQREMRKGKFSHNLKVEMCDGELKIKFNIENRLDIDCISDLKPLLLKLDEVIVAAEEMRDKYGEKES
jgi:hypothetical protein